MELRLLTESDARASTELSHHAFGVPSGDGQPAFTLGPEIRRWGLFDGKTLAAKANDRAYESWLGGRRVPTAGVSGVAVAPEYRGAGLARQVMTHLLAAARERGASISTLFRTAPALYRSLGYEQVAELIDGTFPASALRGIRPVSTRLRRAVPADAAAIRGLYATVAAQGSTRLTREGPAFAFTDEELIAAFDGITLAVDQQDAVVGYVSWHRGAGYGGGATLTVSDLLAVTADGYRALLAALESFAAVTPTIALRTSGDDPVHWLVPGAGWQVTDVRPYMLRVIDLAGAVRDRGWPAGLTGAVTLTVDDPVCPWNTGTHRLDLESGQARLSTADDRGDGIRLTAPGLAVLYAGGIGTAVLRRAGLLSGGSGADSALLDAAFAGPRPAVLDYF